MTRRPDYTSIHAYLPAGPAPAPIAKAPARRSAPVRRIGQMPDKPLSQATWRAWASYALSRRPELADKDARHLEVCIRQTGWLKKWQMRWIFDIVFRVEPSGCGTWGAPD